nr:RNA-directed DNA polymerase, eukaryota, reverse transcriptase zinc-binding domain protein [Tanacetum cinerariifolium]
MLLLETWVGLLKSFPYAEERLYLFEANIYKPEEFEDAIQACVFVFHVATPLQHATGYKEIRDNGVVRDETVGIEDVLKTDAGKVVEDDSIGEDKDQSLNEAKENEIVIEGKIIAVQEEIDVDEGSNNAPIEIDSNGNEIMVFDDVMIAEGSKRMGIGRVGFARVLVEVTVQKPLPTDIEIVYKNGTMQCGSNKDEVRAEGSRKNVSEEKRNEVNPVKRKNNGMVDSEGFIAFQKKRNGGVTKRVLKPNYKPNTQHTRARETVMLEETVMNNNSGNQKPAEKTPNKKAWSAHDDILSTTKRSANKFYVFELYDENELNEIQDMKNREKWKNDMYTDDTGMAKCMEKDDMDGIERRRLWKDLQIQKRIVRDKAWIMIGDMNVTLAFNEHSAGGSRNTTSVLKKLDKVMGNEEFIDKFSQAHAIFLPYLISDHCPIVIILPNVIQAKKRAFKFANFIADKQEFLHIVEITKVESIKSRIVGGGNMFHGKEVAYQFVKHFQDFLGKDVLVKDFKSSSHLIKKQLSTDAVNFIVRDICDEEIKEENINLAQELLKGYDRKDGPNRVAMKIDIQKAYDTIIGSFWKLFLRDLVFMRKWSNGLLVVLQLHPFQYVLMGRALCTSKEEEGWKKHPNLTGKTETQTDRVRFRGELAGLGIDIFVSGYRFAGNEAGTDVDYKWVRVRYTKRPEPNPLPSLVIKDINRLLKGFLWNQGELSKGKAKVAWKDIYKPKSQGGLGLKDLGVWIKVMIAKHL